MIIASDLEGTLTGGETWRGIRAYLEHCGRKRDYDAFMRRHLLNYLGAKVGVIPKRTFQNRWITDLPQLFKGATLEEFQQIAAWVAQHELLPKLRRSPLAELEAAKISGARVILVSGTYQPVLEAFPINTGAIKCSSLRAQIGATQLHRAYGDTMPDVPMLEAAIEAVIVTGNDLHLERLAKQRGWRTLE